MFNRQDHRVNASFFIAAFFLPAAAMAASSPAEKAAQHGAAAGKESGPFGETGKKAGDIVTQPVRDVGVAKRQIPPVLQAAAHDPYGLNGTKTCAQLTAGLRQLNAALGPDFRISSGRKENKAGKLAEAGGKTIVNALIPFRGLVREISGAAPAQRRLNAAIDAGYARRGFLRGLHHNRKCRTQP